MRTSFLIAGVIAGFGAMALHAQSGEAFEKEFLAMMPHHHQQAVEMSQVCTNKAAKNEVRSFCSQLIATQAKEKQQMESWRQNWYGGQGQAPRAEMQTMNAKHKKHMAELNGVSGEKFDRLFLTAMIEHHRDGMPHMKACQARAVHSELKQMCAQMESSQQKEIGQMQSWLPGGR